MPVNAPTIVSNQNGVVTLSLNQRPFTGDGPLVGMHVQYKQSATPQHWDTVSESPTTRLYTLEHLIGETQYDIRVVLVRDGDEGQGVPGPTLTFTTACSGKSTILKENCIHNGSTD